MQGGIVARKCLCVRPSAKCVDCDKTEEKSVQMFIPHERSFSLVFWKKEWLVHGGGAGDPFYLKFWVKLTVLERSRRIFNLFSLVAVTPSEKSPINTNRKSTTRFPMSPIWTSYVVPKPQTVAQKRKVSKNLNNSETIRVRHYERISTENRRFRSKGVIVWPKFQVGGVAPANHSSRKTRLNDLLWRLIKICTNLSFILSQCTRLTDRQTDEQTSRENSNR